MEADRGQVDVASALSVGVHTSLHTSPGPDPRHTNTHWNAHTLAVARELLAVGRNVLTMAWNLNLCFVSWLKKDNDAVGMIYDHRRGAVSVGSCILEWGASLFEVLCSCELFSLWFTQHCCEMNKGEGVCVRINMCVVTTAGVCGGRSQIMGVSWPGQKLEGLATVPTAGIHQLQREDLHCILIVSYLCIFLHYFPSVLLFPCLQWLYFHFATSLLCSDHFNP